MDSKKHTDWTDAVRDRLEGRELTPSDALWERIGASAPKAGATHKVRRLAWGSAAGVAAAAALAAVLFLRPAGAPQPGQVEVVPSAAAPVAEALQAEPAIEAPQAEPAAEAPKRTAATAAPQGKPAAQAFEATPVTTASQGEKQPATAAPVTVSPERPSRPDERQTKTQSTNEPTVTKQVTASAKEPSMTMEEYIAQEKAARRRHASFGAAVYASGLSTVNPSAAKDESLALPSADRMAYTSYPLGVSDIPSPQDTYSYTPNPEAVQGYTPIKAVEDPYNINGTRLNHSKPINVGIALTLPLTDHLFLESGAYWSYLHSSSYLVDQSLHSAGIPLKLGYRLGGLGRASLSLSAGAKAEKVVYAVRAGERFKEPGIQLAAAGSASVQYDLTPGLGIFLAPELSYWFTETKLPTYNTEHPFNLSLKAGLNLTLGR